jgi:dihydropteroate synthase
MMALVSTMDVDAVRVWALLPLAQPSDSRVTAFQKLRLVGARSPLEDAATRFAGCGGWASEITAAPVPDGDDDDRRADPTQRRAPAARRTAERVQLVLAGTLAQYDRFIAAGLPGPLGGAVGRTLASIISPPPRMVLGAHLFEFATRVYVAGILNNTPDSFYDQGAFFGLDAALDRAELLATEGADLIEVGGETAQEGDAVSVREEIDRVVPLVRALVRRFGLPVAVDTYKADVARAALDAGAVLVNDISGMSDPQMPRVVAAGGAGLVLMHLAGRPKQHYTDVPVPSMMDRVGAFLHRRTEAAVAAGVPRDRLLVDPGLDFGKHPARDLELMRRLPELRSLGFPIFVATSRKDYIRDLLHLHPDDLLEGTAAAVAFAVAQGANMLRVHDVQTMVRVVRMMEFFRGYRAVDVPEGAPPQGVSIRGQAEH